MLTGQPLQLGGECTRRAESQVGLDALLQARQAQLLQPGDLGLRERLVAKIGQRRTLPQGERLT